MAGVGCSCIRAVLRDRAEDLEEVRLMIEAGEIDIALDELRWLLSGLRRVHRRPRAARRAGRGDARATCRWPAGITAPAINSDCKRCGGPRCRSRCCIRSRPTGRSSKPAAGSSGRWKSSASRKWRKKSSQRSSSSIRPIRFKLRAMLDELRTGGAPIVDSAVAEVAERT